jgi:hypothetical protein
LVYDGSGRPRAHTDDISISGEYALLSDLNNQQFEPSNKNNNNNRNGHVDYVDLIDNQSTITTSHQQKANHDQKSDSEQKPHISLFGYERRRVSGHK